MRNILRLMAVIILLVSSIGVAFGATVTFDKLIDVPNRDFTVTYQESTFSFTIDNIGNYKFGDSIEVAANGGVNKMRLVIWSVDKLSTWSESYESPGGSISTTIPADRFDPSCQGVCDNNKMGPGIYALTVQDMVNGPKYIIAKPFIISEFDLRVTPDKTQVEPRSSINVIVKISKSGSLVDVSNNVKVEFVQDSTNTRFGAYATKISTGTYEAKIPIPQTASGTHLLYAAITTNKNIYQDYPEIMGAGSYNGNILITNSASTQTTTTPSSGGGGGGGGGAGPSGEDLLNIEVKEKYELDILKDKIISYRFKNASNPINFINITGNTSVGGITTSVEVLKDTSSLVKTPALGLVYKNMNIWVGTSGFAVPKNINTAVIGFKVDNSWIKSNGLSSSDVKLVKWGDGQWIQLETIEMGNSGEFALFEAKTNSFSPFAIAVNTPEITPSTVPVQTKQPIITQTTTEVPTGTSTEITAIPATTYITIAIAILLILIIVAGVNMMRKRKEK